MPTDPQTNAPGTPEISDADVNARVKERFKELPKVVQDAIMSADIQKRLRSVSDNHKLHLDQWGILENEVMLTVLGFQEPKDLASNIQSEVGITAEEAAVLANEINKIVFEPIRQELERGLSHAEAQAENPTPEEIARKQLLADTAAAAATGPAPVSETPVETAPLAEISVPPLPQPTPQAVVPATPPAAPPAEKAVRAPISSSYTSRQASTERKGVEGDPYRELPN